MNKRAEWNWFTFFFIVVVLIFATFLILNLTGHGIKEMDSDNDGLSDTEELRIGTNASNPNTDGDRYKDGEEVKMGTNPNKTNSAYISIPILNPKKDLLQSVLIINGAKIGIALITCTSGTLSACATSSVSVWNSIGTILDKPIYRISGDAVFTNTGDDYTTYLSYYITYKIGDKVLSSSPVYIDKKIKPNQIVSVPYLYEIKVGDIENIFWNLLTDNKIDVKIENLNYEKF